MRINTRDLGEMEISKEGLVEFVAPILGFEQCRQFVLLYDDELGEMFTWLQSTEDSDVCFILVDPAMIDPAYAPALPKDACKMLGFGKNAKPLFLSITVITDNFADATVNLKSPIVINADNNTAMQVVLEDEYPVRALLLPENAEA